MWSFVDRPSVVMSKCGCKLKLNILPKKPLAPVRRASFSDGLESNIGAYVWRSVGVLLPPPFPEGPKGRAALCLLSLLKAG